MRPSSAETPDRPPSRKRRKKWGAKFRRDGRPESLKLEPPGIAEPAAATKTADRAERKAAQAAEREAAEAARRAEKEAAAEAKQAAAEAERKRKAEADAAKRAEREAAAVAKKEAEAAKRAEKEAAAAAKAAEKERMEASKRALREETEKAKQAARERAAAEKHAAAEVEVARKEEAEAAKRAAAEAERLRREEEEEAAKRAVAEAERVAAAEAERLRKEEAEAAERAEREQAEAQARAAAEREREEAAARARAAEAEAARIAEVVAAEQATQEAEVADREPAPEVDEAEPVETEEADAVEAPAARPGRWAALEQPTAKTAVSALVGLVVLSTLLRIASGTQAHAALVFSDELGYEKLAQSIGDSAKLALYNNDGLSYSPLYSVVISPIYVLGVSAPTAYALIKVVNALLISLAIFPTYKIARYALSRRDALIVAALSVVAPLMFYTSFTMSENLAYPACLLAVWAMLEAVRAPGIRTDALLIGAVALAVVARVQLIALLPAALAAIVLAALLRPVELEQPTEPLHFLHTRPTGRAQRTLAEHALFFTVLVVGVVFVGVAAIGGQNVWSAFGRYDVVGRAHPPDVLHFGNLLVRHLGGLDLAVGVVPFVGALVAGFVFARSRFPQSKTPFAAVAVSVTVLFLLETAYDAAVFDKGDVPRIHERFLIYVVPFFLTALFAAARSSATTRVFLGAAMVAALLPVVIPFHTVVNQTIVADTFGLEPFAHWRAGRLVAIPHAAAVAVVAASLLGGMFAAARTRTRSVAVLALIPFVLISGLVLNRIDRSTAYVRSLLPGDQPDWVDAANPAGYVVLIGGRKFEDRVAEETAYNNLSIKRLYYVCDPFAGPEFGEQKVTIDRAGRLRGPSGLVHTDYAIAPKSLGLAGRIVARNRPGREVLIAPNTGVLRVPAAKRRQFTCRARS